MTGDHEPDGYGPGDDEQTRKDDDEWTVERDEALTGGAERDEGGEAAAEAGSDEETVTGTGTGNDEGAGTGTEAKDDSANATETAADVSWYEIDPNCSREEFLAVARVYAREVVAAYDLDVDVNELEWEVSTRAKRRAGAVTYRDDEPIAISLTWEHFEQRGWEETAATIRHELIHVHLLHTDGDPSHGPAFEQLADRLDTTINCEQFADPVWWVTCEECGERVGRHRRSKLVEEPERYRCGTCGGTLVVERNE